MLLLFWVFLTLFLRFSFFRVIFPFFSFLFSPPTLGFMDLPWAEGADHLRTERVSFCKTKKISIFSVRGDQTTTVYLKKKTKKKKGFFFKLQGPKSSTSHFLPQLTGSCLVLSSWNSRLQHRGVPKAESHTNRTQPADGRLFSTGGKRPRLNRTVCTMLQLLSDVVVTELFSS